MPNHFKWRESYNRLFERGLSNAVIAKRLGTSETNVRVYRRKAGFKPSFQSKPWEQWEKDLFSQGLTDTEVMEKTGRNFPGVKHARYLYAPHIPCPKTPGPVGLPEFQNPRIARLRASGINAYSTSELELVEKGFTIPTVHKITNRSALSVYVKRNKLKRYQKKGGLLFAS